MNRKISECYDRWVNGDRLNDQELTDLCRAFKRVADASLPLGSRFRLAFNEANSQYMSILSACEARGLELTL